MRESIEEILNDFGWESGFRIPVANEDNRRLEEEIDRKSKQKKQLVEELAINEERVKSIDEYISNVRVEHVHNQKLLTAYGAQLNAESHMLKISEHEESSVAQEIKNSEREKTNLGEKIGMLSKEMGQLQEKLDRLERTVAFDKSKLVQWAQVLDKEEEDEELLQKYMKSDAKEFKGLELKRQKLSQEYDCLKAAVLQTMTDLCEMEIILERTSNFYVEALEERGQLIERWSQSVQVLRQRDSGVHETIREIETLKEIGKDKMAALLECEKFLDTQQSANRYLEDLLKALEKKQFTEREERRKIMDSNSFYELEYQTRRKSLQELSRRSQRLKSDIKSTKNALGTKKKKIQDLEVQIEDIKGSIKEIGDQSISVGDRLKRLEEILAAEEKRKSAVLKETKHFQDLILRTSSKISDLEGERKFVDFQKNGELKKVELFGAHQEREDLRLMEKKQMIDRLNLEIQECEMRLGRSAPDDFSRAEMRRKVELIEKLQKALEEKVEVGKLLHGQLVSLENEVRRIQGSLKVGEDELGTLRSRKQEMGSMMDGGEKQLKSAQTRNEEKQVAENILELRVKQAEHIFRNIGNKLQTLEKYRLQMDSAMKERLAEIKLQKEGLNLEKRAMAAECLEHRSAITERQSRMNHLQSRYDTIIAAMGSNETTGAPVTTTYMKILNAQEKAELQEQGDKLDMTIRRTEQEITSMENTLRIVNACNEKYKTSLSASGGEPDDILRKQLDDEMFQALQILKSKQMDLEDAEAEYQRMLEEFNAIAEELKMAREEKEVKLRVVGGLDKQINEQKERISRAEKSLRKLYKDIQRICENADDDAILLQEKDIATRELQEQNFLALQRITEFTIRHVEAEVYVKKLLSAKNISLPCAQHLKPSPSPSLCDSSRSSLASSGKSRLASRESASKIQTISSEVVFEVVGAPKSSNRETTFNQPAANRQTSATKKT